MQINESEENLRQAALSLLQGSSVIHYSCNMDCAKDLAEQFDRLCTTAELPIQRDNKLMFYYRNRWLKFTSQAFQNQNKGLEAVPIFDFNCG